MADENPIRIGVIGLGRTGWQNHCRQLATLPAMYRITAAADPDPARQDEAQRTFGCRSYPTPEALLADREVELVTIATPSHLHLAHVEAALAAGKHVVCEKPMAGSLADADRMIAAAEKTDRIFTVFQNRRFSPDFLKVQQVIASGVLGRIVQIRVAIHMYGRRWDWQTLRAFDGGELNNTASHYIDEALLLLGYADPDVFCHLDRTLTCGDAEDHCKVVFRAPGCPLVEVEVTYSAAIKQEKWHIMGTHGALAGSADQLRWRVSNLASLPPREADRRPTPDRRYNNEPYEFEEHTWTMPADTPSESIHFYQGLWATVRQGAPLLVTPQSIRRQIDILDRCRASARLGGFEPGSAPATAR